jgi:hypothetical protein
MGPFRIRETAGLRNARRNRVRPWPTKSYAELVPGRPRPSESRPEIFSVLRDLSLAPPNWPSQLSKIVFLFFAIYRGQRAMVEDASPRKKACATCGYADRSAPTKMLECRRLPPTFRYSLSEQARPSPAELPKLLCYAAFPQVLESEWCGAWRDKAVPERAVRGPKGSSARSRPSREP